MSAEPQSTRPPEPEFIIVHGGYGTGKTRLGSLLSITSEWIEGNTVHHCKLDFAWHKYMGVWVKGVKHGPAITTEIPWAGGAPDIAADDIIMDAFVSTEPCRVYFHCHTQEAFRSLCELLPSAQSFKLIA